MRLLTLAIVFLKAASALAVHSLELDARYQASRSIPNSLQQSLSFTTLELNPVTLSVRARLAESIPDVGFLHYGADAGISPWSWVSFWLRASQQIFIGDGTSATHLSARLRLNTGWGSLRLLGETGLFHRSWSLAHARPIPTFSNVSLNEYDLLVNLGIRWHFAELWSIQAQLSTVELLDIYNLNHPFVETRVWHTLSETDLEAFAYFRYQILLGFGLIENWTVGLGISTRL